jgi:rare lipoprotein A
VRGYNRPYLVKDQWYSPQFQPEYDEIGIASWYGYESGRTTANGEVFETDTVATAAHTTLPIPSLLQVTNLENGRTIQVRLNDRGPFVSGRLIDLSREAARELGFLEKGTARVRVRYLGPAPFVPVTRVMQIASAAPVRSSPTSRPASVRAAAPVPSQPVVDDPMSLVAGLGESAPPPQR